MWLTQIALHLWCLGFGFLTLDRILVYEWGAYSVKASYFFFVGAFLLLALGQWQQGLIKSFIARLWAFIFSYWGFVLGLAILGALSSIFAILQAKAILYALWLVFNVLVIGFAGIILLNLERGPNRLRAVGIFFRYLAISVILLGIVVHIDYFAHFYGYKSGFIGYNQGDNSWYVNSRPHAFSFEPSYLALYFSFAALLLFHQSVLAKMPELPRWLAVSALVLAVNVLLFTFARSVLLSVALVFMVLLFSLGRELFRVSVKPLYLFTTIVAVGSLFLILTPKPQLNAVYDVMVYRLLQGKDWSLDSRVDGFVTAWEIAKRHNFIGVGMGSSYNYWFHEMNGAAMSAALKEGEVGRHKIQNIWLELFAELGVLGIAFLGAFSFGFIRSAHQAAKSSGNSLAYIGFASGFVLLLFTIHWFPNVSRSDIWAWLSVWSAFQAKAFHT